MTRLRTVADVFDPAHNSLNAIRLLLAVCVVVSHAGPLTNRAELHVGGVTLGAWAVVGFFVISGMLITRSRLRTTARVFYWDRFLRIYPAFLVALLACAFVFAPLSTLFTHRAYSPASAVSFVQHNLPLYELHLHQEGIASTNTGTGNFALWDGPLYTLFFEGVCYVAVGVLVSVLRERLLRMLMPVVAVALAVAAAVGPMVGPTPGDLERIFLVHFGAAFAAGSAVWLWRDRVPVNGRVAAICLAGVVLLLSLGAPGASVALLLVPVVVWLGAVLPLQRLGAVHDYSYGMYLYGWPMQILLILAVPAHVFDAPEVVDIVIVLTLTAGCAVLSRLLVEEPALRLRRLARGSWRTTLNREAPTILSRSSLRDG